ncbi:tRNA(Ile)-lysidine synthase [Lactobacillus colini]|uniref:tRNA(Ile)-lysidine synthase n=1 Tax=Lactobacillus colini TaxID=1819254 RepID=A0ABS4MC64_9LACO|nr:tRNA lysidine(34) synthetase TilS [Lactobacillus colini]MBP2057279.1 tRNA(Ile)-lysidine synthase [Lactobacillus colini]
MIREFFQRNNLKLENKKILLAASGGPDSMALLQMLLDELKHEQIIVAHLDHQLRADSYLETELLEKFCQKNKVTLFTKKWPLALHKKTGVEASARQYRYEFLDSVARKENVDYLLTAHHGDDLLENILLKLIRSGNANEMSSLRPVRCWQGRVLVRPLLNLSKAELLSFDKERHIPYVKDSTNDEDDVLRNRLRHHVVPLLNQENAKIIVNGMHFLDSISLLQEEREAYFDQFKADSFMGCLRISDNQLEKLPLRLRADYFSYLILNKWHKQVKFETLIKDKTKTVNREGFEISYYQGYYYLRRVKDFIKNNTKLQKVVLNQEFKWQNSKYIITNKKIMAKNCQKVGSFYTGQLHELEVGSLLVHTKLRLANGQWTKPKKKFAQEAIPLFLRSRCLSVYTSGEVVFVENTYQKQQYSEDFFKYWIYKLKV